MITLVPLALFFTAGEINLLHLRQTRGLCESPQMGNLATSARHHRLPNLLLDTKVVKKRIEFRDVIL